MRTSPEPLRLSERLSLRNLLRVCAQDTCHGQDGCRAQKRRELDVVGCMVFPLGCQSWQSLLHSDDSELLPITRHAERLLTVFTTRLKYDGRNAVFTKRL